MIYSDELPRLLFPLINRFPLFRKIVQQVVKVMNFSEHIYKMKDLPGASETVQDHRNLLDWTETSSDNATKLPINMRFNEGHELSILVYSILMVFSAVANTTVLVLIVKRRRKSPSRINTMLMHLAIADLLVTFLMMPLEIAWAATVSWRAGDIMCRIMMFFRMFGLYLSSFVLVCISVDRFYAVLKPFYLRMFDRRDKVMLAGAWIGAILCSIPQMVVFHVESHPNITRYQQCVTYNVFRSYAYELAYLLFGMVMMYGLPLVVIIFSYTSILIEICRRTRHPYAEDFTRSCVVFSKAKVRTLKMTIIIVLAFFICWTPYYVMCVWYWLDRESAMKVDQRIQKGLFLFACTNSCMNPVVYGAFNIRARRTGRQIPDRDSETQVSIARKGDVVCLVSWKKPAKEEVTTTRHQRDVCLSCGESFEGICPLSEKRHRTCSCAHDFSTETTVVDTGL